MGNCFTTILLDLDEQKLEETSHEHSEDDDQQEDFCADDFIYRFP